MLSVFPVHGVSDGTFARAFSAFLESGCSVICFPGDAEIRPGHDLLIIAKAGYSADVLVLLMSPASNPAQWPRERWESVLFTRAEAADTRVALFLLEECAFPPVLRRRLNFVDATTDRLSAMRRFKRWLRGVQSGRKPAMTFSADLDGLYRDLADVPGATSASGEFAERFAREAAADFEGVFWVTAQQRSVAQMAGDLGSQLGMVLDGTAEENCARIREVLAARRCLLIFDFPQLSADFLIPGGLTSVLCTNEPVRTQTLAYTFAAARSLVLDRRFAEAYEVLYRLLNNGADAESCARELVWICEHWGRVEEAKALRALIAPQPQEQLSLF